MSMLDRPISEFDGPGRFGARPGRAAAGRVQAVPGGAGRARVAPEAAGLHHAPSGERKFKDYPDFVVNYEPQPGIGFLMGWRGKDGTEHLRGAPNPKQWEMYAKNDCVFQLPPARDDALHAQLEPRVPRLRQGQGLAPEERRRPARALQRHAAGVPPRRAGQDRAAGSRPSTCASASRPTSIRCRSGTRRSRTRPPTPQAYPLNAITQRPMAMYHSWDSQNAWLRQIHSHNYLHVNPLTAQAAGIADGGWCWVESPGAGCAACCATARRSSRARCGPGTRSARPTAPGSSRRAPTRRGRASSSIT